MSARKRKAAAAKVPFNVTVLAARWPKAFAVYEKRRRPLALHIHRLIIIAAAPGIAAGKITKDELYRALACYCRNDGYLRACKAGAVRLDLNGKPAGVVTQQEADYARAVLKARKAAKRAAKQTNTAADESPALRRWPNSTGLEPDYDKHMPATR
jgi:ProP effector